MNLAEQIDLIEIKVRQLATKVERVQQENAALQEVNQQLKAELDRQKGGMDALKDKLEIAQRALGSRRNGKMEQSEKLKEQLDQYIHEIDKCIEWLHKH
jgi:predicted  nucleic acid-binding Zn-ribbon protein